MDRLNAVELKEVSRAVHGQDVQFSSEQSGPPSGEAENGMGLELREETGTFDCGQQGWPWRVRFGWDAWGVVAVGSGAGVPLSVKVGQHRTGKAALRAAAFSTASGLPTDLPCGEVGGKG